MKHRFRNCRGRQVHRRPAVTRRPKTFSCVSLFTSRTSALGIQKHRGTVGCWSNKRLIAGFEPIAQCLRLTTVADCDWHARCKSFEVDDGKSEESENGPRIERFQTVTGQHA
jgi:hypothetical protein